MFGSRKVIEEFKNIHIFDPGKDLAYNEIDKFSKKIINIWSRCFRYNIFEIVNTRFSKDKKDAQRCLNYIVYKTLEISHTNTKNAQSETNLFDEKKLEKYIIELYEVPSPISSTLFRCFAFLFFHFYWSKDFDGLKEFPINDYWDRARAIMSSQDPLKQEMSDLEGLDARDSFGLPVHKWTREELLPAPSFETDFVIKEINDGKKKKELVYIPFSSLSSVEKQMIFLFTTVVYHLQNIESIGYNQTQMQESDSADGRKAIVYHNVQIIFDEIELYFHPEYQMELVGLLIKYLSTLSYTSIQNVNILIATHSPFVLSDIPKNNILCLDDGIPREIKTTPFGANIFEILNSHFFLDSFIGDFSKQKIQDMAQKLVDMKKLSKDDTNEIRKEINFIGDDMVRQMLLSKLHQLQ